VQMVNSKMSPVRNASMVENAAGIEHIHGLYSYALVLSRNRAEAEDLVQETYVRAIQAMDRLKPDSNVKSWLFTIIRNIWLNQLRRQRAAPNMIEMDAEEGIAAAVVEASKDPPCFVCKQAGKRAGAQGNPTALNRLS
jgi:RNA polymerase sigma-70 factor, ECF subfamily